MDFLCWTALNMARYREAVCSALWEQLVLVVCYAPSLTLSTLVIIWRTYSLHLLVTSGITTLSVCFKVHPDAFEYVNFHPCQAKGKGFVRGETQCLLWEDSSCSMFNKNIQCFKYAHKNREYQSGSFKKCISKFDFTGRERSLENLFG